MVVGSGVDQGGCSTHHPCRSLELDVLGRNEGTHATFTTKTAYHPDALPDGECSRGTPAKVLSDFHPEPVGSPVDFRPFGPAVLHFHPVAVGSLFSQRAGVFSSDNILNDRRMKGEESPGISLLASSDRPGLPKAHRIIPSDLERRLQRRGSPVSCWISRPASLSGLPESSRLEAACKVPQVSR